MKYKEYLKKNKDQLEGRSVNSVTKQTVFTVQDLDKLRRRFSNLRLSGKVNDGAGRLWGKIIQRVPLKWRNKTR